MLNTVTPNCVNKCIYSGTKPLGNHSKHEQWWDVKNHIKHILHHSEFSIYVNYFSAVGNVSDDALKREDNCPGWNPDNKRFQILQVASNLAESSNLH